LIIFVLGFDGNYVVRINVKVCVYVSYTCICMIYDQVYKRRQNNKFKRNLVEYKWHCRSTDKQVGSNMISRIYTVQAGEEHKLWCLVRYIYFYVRGAKGDLNA